MLEQFEAAGVTCYVMGLQGTRTHPRTLRRLVALLRREKIDVICSCNTPLDRTYAQLAGLIAQVPVLVWLMIVAIPLLRFPPPRGRELAFLKRLALWPVNFVSARRVAGFMSLSHSVTQSFARHLRLHDSEFILVPPGLTAGFYTSPKTKEELQLLREELGVATAYPLILNVGTLSELKGQHHLVPFLAGVLQQLPQAHLLLVGDGPARVSLEDAIGAAGLRERIHLLGHRQDVPALLAASDVLISASRTEGFGMAVLEAMAASKPVVAAFTPAFTEFAVAGETALFVDRPDPALLAAAVVALFSEVGRAETMGRAGRDAAEAYRAEYAAQKVDDVIARILADAR